MANALQPVKVDLRSGRVSDAGGIERCGIMMMQTAARVQRRLEIRGFSWAVRVISAALPSRSVVRVMLDDDCAFEMPYGDGYWSWLLLRGAEYEADMHGVMEAIAGVDYAFLDCGANYGYWSVLVSGEKLGRHPAVAIEADSSPIRVCERACLPALSASRKSRCSVLPSDFACCAWM